MGPFLSRERNPAGIGVGGPSIDRARFAAVIPVHELRFALSFARMTRVQRQPR
jgi:hypothetical protein